MKEDIQPIKAAIQFAHHLTDRQEQYLAIHHHCVLCDAELKIVHEDDAQTGRITETAECPQCRIRTRSVQHTKN